MAAVYRMVHPALVFSSRVHRLIAMAPRKKANPSVDGDDVKPRVKKAPKKKEGGVLAGKDAVSIVQSPLSALLITVLLISSR